MESSRLQDRLRDVVHQHNNLNRDGARELVMDQKTYPRVSIHLLHIVGHLTTTIKHPRFKGTEKLGLSRSFLLIEE